MSNTLQAYRITKSDGYFDRNRKILIFTRSSEPDILNIDTICQSADESVGVKEWIEYWLQKNTMRYL